MRNRNSRQPEGKRPIAGYGADEWPSSDREDSSTDRGYSGSEKGRNDKDMERPHDRSDREDVIDGRGGRSRGDRSRE